MEDRTKNFLRYIKKEYYANYIYGYRAITNVKEAQIFASKIDKRFLRKILNDEQYIVLFDDGKNSVLLFRTDDMFYVKYNDRVMAAV